jgi:hypothetical protein
VSRSISQLYVMLNLLLLPQPLPAVEISDTLAIAYSIGDRRDHFEARKVVWEVVALIVEERKQRKIDPTRYAELKQSPKSTMVRLMKLGAEMAELISG